MSEVVGVLGQIRGLTLTNLATIQGQLADETVLMVNVENIGGNLKNLSSLNVSFQQAPGTTWTSAQTTLLNTIIAAYDGA